MKLSGPFLASASLTNPSPDCSNYSPFCHNRYRILRINTSLVLWARPFTKSLHWRIIGTSLLQRSTAESSLELRSNIVPCQIVNSVPFCLFSLYLSPLPATFLNLLSSPFSSFRLTSPTPLLSLLINSLSS